MKKAKTEEEVKSIFAKCFAIQYNTSDKHDLYTPQVLFEFKFDKNLNNIKTRATVLAQILYYVRRLRFGKHIDKSIPPALCLADEDEGILLETATWRDYYNDTQLYDWDLAPSNPDIKLIKDLMNDTKLVNNHVFDLSKETEYNTFSNLLSTYLDSQVKLNFLEKKIINEENFEDVFEYWNNIFGDAVRNGLKTSRYFVCDIQAGNTIYLKDESKVIFQFANGEAKIKKILQRDYEHFWGLYEKVNNPNIIRSILAKIDRLSDDVMRRFHGEFFTPVLFAKKGLEYIEKVLGQKWWESGEYRLWDMAAGTGNLEYYLPQEALQYCYLSTLYKEDVEHCQKLFTEATIFQYDYLNDDVENIFSNGMIHYEYDWKLPNSLKNDLANPKLKWIILINPPFATSQTAGTTGKSKQGVSDTKIRKIMHKENLGEVSRELFSQFLYRIKYEFKGKTAHLGLFSKIKYLNANNDEKLREKIFQFQFEKGFVFSSINFSGTSKNNSFPVGFLLWNLKNNLPLDNQSIELDIFDNNIQKIDIKKIKIDNKSLHLNKWIKRPSATQIFPPFSSAITIKTNNKDVRNRIAKDFLMSLMCAGNNFQCQNQTALLSGPCVSAGALSVTPDNFEKAMIIHAVRRIPKATWLNDRDQFLQPNQNPSQEFIVDCTIWNLFSGSNATAAIKDVHYENKIYQVQNHFFAFDIEEIKTWKITDSDIFNSLLNAKNCFLFEWLQKQKISAEAKLVLEEGKKVYQFFYAHLSQMRTPKFKIQTFDAGWWQVRNALQDVNLGKIEIENLKNAHTTLKQKLEIEIKKYHFF